MLGMFLLCAVLPILGLAGIAYVKVEKNLEMQGRDRVQLGSKIAGLAIFDRLIFVKAELKAHLTNLNYNRAVAVSMDTSAFATPRLRSLALIRDTGDALPIFGDLPELADLTSDERVQLQSGRAVLRSIPSPSPRILMGVGSLDHAGDVLWAEVDPVYLWRAGDDDVALASEAEICVFDAKVLPIYCSIAEPTDLVRQLTAALSTIDAGNIQWEVHEPYVAGYWSLFLKHEFLEPKWTVVLSEPHGYLLAGLSQFQQSFPFLVLLGVLIVVLVSRIEIRRTLEPLSQLSQATRRLGSGDFTNEVVIDTGDEFEDLALSFNRMTLRIRHQFEERDRLNASLAGTTSQLRYSEARLRTILESSTDGIVTSDERGVIESFSETAMRMFGYQVEDVHGKHIRMLLGGGEGVVDSKALVGIDGATGSTTETEARRKDGRTFPVELAIQRAQVEGRSILIAFFRDLTQRKRAEQEQRLLEEKLVQAQKLETIGTLAGGIAHDFNNILTPIGGYVDLALRDVPADSETHADLLEVRKATRRAGDLVRQILTFSRGHSSERELVQLGPIVHDVIKLLRATVPTTIDIRYYVEPNCGAVEADGSQIHQVLMNLGTNAYHAMREQGGTLEIRLDAATVDGALAAQSPRLDVGEYVRLTVRDTGHGMDADTQARLFEPFFTTKKVGEGTGLGLSVVHGIVMSHDGEITVDSTPGFGTTFTVYLPMVEEAASVATHERRVVCEGDEQVLVVDDDPDIGPLVKRMLERLGYHVTVESNGRDALETFRSQPTRFDVVVTDQTMPQLTGTELVHELRKIRPNIPVVMTTGYSPATIADFVGQAADCVMVSKPYTVEELTEAVRGLLTTDGVAGVEVRA